MSDHGKIIHKVAKNTFKAYKIKRKGRSRTWLDDQNWFTTVIEFQPHKWKHGAFLNVGACFHWYVKDYLTFDMGYRESGFEEFETAEQFEANIQGLVDLALEKALYYRKQLASISQAAATIQAEGSSSPSLWGNYHKGVISALNGDSSAAIKYFSALLEVEHDVPWANELKERTLELIPLTEDSTAFQHKIETIIQEARRLKKLPELTSISWEIED